MVVDETGWLTWVDYIHLVLAAFGWGTGDRLLFYTRWSRNEKLLRDQVLLMAEVLQEPKGEPFAPILRKVISRGLAEFELRKIYLEEVKNRCRDFREFGRSLNFSAEDLERDRVNTLEDGRSE